MDREDNLQVRPVDDGVAERAYSGAVAEKQVFHAGLAQLFGQQVAARAPDGSSKWGGILWRRVLGVGRFDSSQDRSRGGYSETGLGHGFQEAAAVHALL